MTRTTNLTEMEASMMRAKVKRDRMEQAERTAMRAYHRAVDRHNSAKAGLSAAVMAFEQAAHAAKQAGV